MKLTSISISQHTTTACVLPFKWSNAKPRNGFSGWLAGWVAARTSEKLHDLILQTVESTMPMLWNCYVWRTGWLLAFVFIASRLCECLWHVWFRFIGPAELSHCRKPFTVITSTRRTNALWHSIRHRLPLELRFHDMRMTLNLNLLNGP